MTAADPEALPKIRLYVAAALTNEQQVELSPAQAHYLLRVMRLAVDDRIRVFNGSDGEWIARLVPGGRTVAKVQLDHQVRIHETEEGPWLAFAPVKKSATDYIVEKATELGASKLLPVITERTVAQRVNVTRLLAIATEAAEQCGRLSVPDLAAPVALPAFIQTWPAQRALLVAHPHPHPQKVSLPALSTMAAMQSPLAEPFSTTSPSFLIGPEGGFTAKELNVLVGLSCAKVVSLGPRTLRTETAAAAALACWQALVDARRGDVEKS